MTLMTKFRVARKAATPVCLSLSLFSGGALRREQQWHRQQQRQQQQQQQQRRQQQLQGES